MGLKKNKPVTPSRRYMIMSDFEEITKSRPVKKLLAKRKNTGGRNNAGRITSRHRGGGHKRKYRLIDFKRNKVDIPARVCSIEYDPNRSARIAHIIYQDGEQSYILAPLDLRVGDQVISGTKGKIKAGNHFSMIDIPAGTVIHNIELRIGKGGEIARSAGAGATLLTKEDRYAHVKLPSGEVRLIPMQCRATIGQLGNVDHNSISSGKAGRSRWLGRRPQTRGVAMNPVDHPLGGGEGKSSGGRHPCTPWGKPTKGYRTRRKKLSDRYIVKRREVNKKIYKK